MNKIENKGLFFLVKGEWSRLRTLSLKHCSITFDGLKLLAHSSWLHLAEIYCDEYFPSCQWQKYSYTPYNPKRKIVKNYTFSSLRNPWLKANDGINWFNFFWWFLNFSKSLSDCEISNDNNAIHLNRLMTLIFITNNEAIIKIAKTGNHTLGSHNWKFND
jgi:hypothetical protein